MCRSRKPCGTHASHEDNTFVYITQTFLFLQRNPIYPHSLPGASHFRIRFYIIPSSHKSPHNHDVQDSSRPCRSATCHIQCRGPYVFVNDINDINDISNVSNPKLVSPPRSRRSEFYESLPYRTMIKYSYSLISPAVSRVPSGTQL